MDHEKTKSETLAGHEKSPLDAGNVDIHRLPSRQSMIMVGQLTPHWEQTMSGRCGIWDNSIDRPQRKHSHCGSHDCSAVAETIPSCDRRTPQNQVEDLIVENTKGS